MKIMFLGKLPRPSVTYDHTVIEQRIMKHMSPGTQIVCDFPDNYDGSKAEKVLGRQKMLNGTDHVMVTVSLMRKVLWAEENGFDAVVQSNTFDPGVEACRALVKIPVIGIFRTSLHIATTLADRIGILVPLESHVPYTWRILRTYGMDGLVSGIEPLGIYGSDLKDRIPEIEDRACGLIRKLVKENGAHFIIPLGGALIPYLVQPDRLSELTGVPVMNTTNATVRFAESCVALGLAHSPLSYPRGKLTSADLVDRV
jgi:allantoin racemase